MRARTGDWLVVRGAIVGKPETRGRILEVRGRDGAPPYVVRWLKDDRVGVVFPGPDAHVVSAEEQRRPDDVEGRRIESVQRTKESARMT